MQQYRPFVSVAPYKSLPASVSPRAPSRDASPCGRHRRGDHDNLFWWRCCGGHTTHEPRLSAAESLAGGCGGWVRRGGCGGWLWRWVVVAVDGCGGGWLRLHSTCAASPLLNPHSTQTYKPPTTHFMHSTVMALSPLPLHSTYLFFPLPSSFFLSLSLPSRSH